MFMSLGFHGVDDCQYSLLIDFPVITHSWENVKLSEQAWIHYFQL